MKRTEKCAANIINRIIDLEMYGWPPVCLGTIYQPTRPSTTRQRKPSFEKAHLSPSAERRKKVDKKSRG